MTSSTQPPPQRRIGLTGGIATGKSSVGLLLAEHWGLPVLDADVYAREALAPGTPATAAVLARHGAAVQSADPTGAASLDRAALGRIVFADPGEQRWLEQLVHPIVRRRFDAELARLQAARVVVLMIPLLFEAGLEGLCSEVWLVDCDEAEQLARLMARDHCSEAEARSRIAAQWPLARKRLLADRVIDNRGAPAALEPHVERALGLSPSASR
jgi:dephospho-CoA kinase